MPMDQGSLSFWNIDFKITKWIYHLKERKWSNQERKKNTLRLSPIPLQVTPSLSFSTASLKRKKTNFAFSAFLLSLLPLP